MLYIWFLWAILASALASFVGNSSTELQAYLWCSFGLLLGILYAALIFFSDSNKIKNSKSSQLGVLLIVLVTHIIFLISKPIKEDDYFRYSFDGRNSRMGIHPYDKTPLEIMQTNIHSPDYLNLINYPNYKTIYPPIAQVFFLSEVFYPDTIYGWWILVAILDLFAVVFSWLYINKNKIHWQYFAFLWLNPIWLKEGLNSGHLDILAGLFLLISIYLYNIPSKKHQILSVILLGLTMGIRPWFGIFGLYYLFTGKFKYFFVFSLTFILPWVILFSLPNAPAFLDSMSSWGHFVKKWEFNSIFYDLFYRLNKTIFTDYSWARGFSWLMGIFVMMFVLLKNLKNADFVFWGMCSVTAWLLFQPTANAWYFLPGIIVSGSCLLYYQKNEMYYKGYLAAFAIILPLSYMHYLDLKRDFLDYKWALLEILLIFLVCLLFYFKSVVQTATKKASSD